jgi:exonuclease VII large subunit
MNIISNKIALVSKSLEAHDIEKSLKKGFALIKQNAKFVTRKKIIV